jgi:hypothetical protein
VDNTLPACHSFFVVRPGPSSRLSSMAQSHALWSFTKNHDTHSEEENMWSNKSNKFKEDEGPPQLRGYCESENKEKRLRVAARKSRLERAEGSWSEFTEHGICLRRLCGYWSPSTLPLMSLVLLCTSLFASPCLAAVADSKCRVGSTLLSGNVSCLGKQI